MDRISRPTLLPALMVAALLVQPAASFGQCTASTSTQMIGNGFTVLKFLTANTTCTRTSNNAMTCSPAGPVMTTGLLARATTGSTMTMAVACGWTCGCGQVTIDGSDGLPVELMDFSIEGSPADDGG